MISVEIYRYSSFSFESLLAISSGKSRWNRAWGFFCEFRNSINIFQDITSPIPIPASSTSLLTASSKEVTGRWAVMKYMRQGRYAHEFQEGTIS
jgi:hypothetical protein